MGLNPCKYIPNQCSVCIASLIYIFEPTTPSNPREMHSDDHDLSGRFLSKFSQKKRESSFPGSSSSSMNQMSSCTEPSGQKTLNTVPDLEGSYWSEYSESLYLLLNDWMDDTATELWKFPKALENQEAEKSQSPKNGFSCTIKGFKGSRWAKDNRN
ncbi:hypothetical protein BT69DRAFT_1148820 [Atractiella rhizophila]|nr:hypothetical protein BT69DRAFT_1148820 [Atractiella rhizophila]